jgi:hypothetical protein
MVNKKRLKVGRNDNYGIKEIYGGQRQESYSQINRYLGIDLKKLTVLEGC